MFERFTERARRSIFFARNEASRLRSPYIETEHLLLGILREHEQLLIPLRNGAKEAIRKRIDDFSTPGPDAVPTSVDLPMSDEARRVLTFASEEFDALQHQFIGSDHLVLGLLRVEGSFAASLLRENGISYSSYRMAVSEAGLPKNPQSSQSVRRRFDPAIERPSQWHSLEDLEPLAPLLKTHIRALQDLVDNAIEHVFVHDEEYPKQRLKRKPWTRKEAMGHLIDCAATHQRWFALALAESKLVAGLPPTDAWVAIQRYDDFSWQDTLDLWLLLNRLLIHVLMGIPEEKLKISCRIGIEQPIPLSELVARYVAHCEDVVGQILARL